MTRSTLRCSTVAIGAFGGPVGILAGGVIGGVVGGLIGSKIGSTMASGFNETFLS